MTRATKQSTFYLVNNEDSFCVGVSSPKDKKEKEKKRRRSKLNPENFDEVRRPIWKLQCYSHRHSQLPKPHALQYPPHGSIPRGSISTVHQQQLSLSRRLGLSYRQISGYAQMLGDAVHRYSHWTSKLAKGTYNYNWVLLLLFQ